MNYIRYLVAISLLTSCSESPQNSLNDTAPVENDREAKEFIQLLRPSKNLEYSKLDSNYVDYWCSTNILSKTEKNINNLDLVLVADFLATFHKSCKNNAEYSEWSNRLLFKVISKRPDNFLELLSKNSSLSRDLIVDELKNPIFTQINLDQFSDHIEQLEIPNSEEWKSKIIKSIKTARRK